MKFDFFKKITICVIGVTIISGFFFLQKPQKAEAGVPVVEIGANLIANQTHLAQFTLKEWALDTAGWAVTKAIINSIALNIIDWINSGFEGNPTFVQNPDAFFKELADQASGAVINQLGMEGLLCSPFRAQLLASLRMYNASFSNIYSKYQCTLTDAVNNWNGFMDNFLNGGWDTWIQITSAPQNNPYGTYLLALDQLTLARANAEAEGQMKTTWGQGFYPLEECAGGGDQEAACDQQCAPVKDDPDLFDECFNGCMSIDMSVSESCKLSGGQMRATTPGKVIADQLNNVLASPIRQLELADELKEAISGIVNALINQLISQGLSGL